MAIIDAWLPSEQLDRLTQAYQKEEQVVIDLLSKAMPGIYDRTLQYIGAIRVEFYDLSTRAMTPKDRERCLIAILASRDAGLNLAIHIYLGLMEGLSAPDIAEILFLSGAYTGVDRLSDGLVVEWRTLDVLRQLASDPNGCAVNQVMGKLRDTFGPPLPALPPPPKSSQK